MAEFDNTPLTPVTPEAIKRRRAIAAAAARKAGEVQPSYTHWAQAIGQGIQGLAAGVEERRLDELERTAAVRDAANFSGLTTAMAQGAPAAGSFGVSGPTAIAAPAVRTSSAGGAPSFVSAEGTQPTGKFTGGNADFVAALSPHALSVSEQTGVDPRIVIAQSALETGFGRSAPGNNFFGIKGPGNKLATNEVVDGQTGRINVSFRTS